MRAAIELGALSLLVEGSGRAPQVLVAGASIEIRAEVFGDWARHRMDTGPFLLVRLAFCNLGAQETKLEHFQCHKAGRNSTNSVDMDMHTNAAGRCG